MFLDNLYMEYNPDNINNIGLNRCYLIQWKELKILSSMVQKWVTCIPWSIFYTKTTQEKGYTDQRE